MYVCVHTHTYIHVQYQIWQQQHLYTLAHPRVLNKIKIKKGRHVHDTVTVKLKNNRKN
jgi:hypothetical protein